MGHRITRLYLLKSQICIQNICIRGLLVKKRKEKKKKAPNCSTTTCACNVSETAVKPLFRAAEYQAQGTRSARPLSLVLELSSLRGKSRRRCANPGHPLRVLHCIYMCMSALPRSAFKHLCYSQTSITRIRETLSEGLFLENNWKVHSLVPSVVYLHQPNN